ncbi:MAG: DsbA family protein [Pseudomonadota bacterium]
MKRLIAATALTLLAGPAAAIDLDDLSAAERDAFRAEVRAYLLENPEVLMEAIGILEERQQASAAEAEAMAVAANADLLYNSQFDFVDGNPDGDIVVVEFLDYRCGFCRRAHPEVDALIEQDGNIRLVVKEFPILGEESVLASQFAIATRIALGDEAYAMVHDELMEMRGSVTEGSLRALADDLGYDADAILASMGDPIVEATIQSNRTLAQRLGISGTPSFVFEEQLVRGYVPLDNMVDLVASLRDPAE